MTRDTVPDRDLGRILDEQIDAMQAVLGSLQAERSALAARDGEALLKAVDGKASCVAGAHAAESRRRATFERLGLSERTGRAALRGFSDDAGISHRWQQVLMLTEQCRALNESNGHLIRGQRRRIDGTLGLLRGQPATTVEYDRGGERLARSAQRSLASY